MNDDRGISLFQCYVKCPMSMQMVARLCRLDVMVNLVIHTWNGLFDKLALQGPSKPERCSGFN